MKKYCLIILAIIAGFLSFSATAEPEGSCWATPAYNSPVNLVTPFSSGKKGSKATYNLLMSTSSHAATCQSYSGAPPNGNNKIAYFKIVYPPIFTPTADGIKLTDYVNMSNVAFAARTSFGEQYDTSIPQSNYYDYPSTVNCGRDNEGAYCIKTNQGAKSGPYAKDIYSTIEGTSFDLVLTKDVLGGAITIPPLNFLNVYYSATSGQFAAQPFEQFAIPGMLIPVPIVCNINNGQQINVDFGDIQSADISSNGKLSLAKIKKSIDVSCSTSLNQDIDVKLTAFPTTFSKNAISSSSPDVGVEFYQDSKLIPVNSFFQLHLTDGNATTNVTFAVVKDPDVVTLHGGYFSASATLVMYAN